MSLATPAQPAVLNARQRRKRGVLTQQMCTVDRAWSNGGSRAIGNVALDCYSSAMIIAALFMLVPHSSADALGAEGVVVDKIAAVVNDGIVLESEVTALLEQDVASASDDRHALQAKRQRALDTLIAERLLDDEVKKLRIAVTDDEIDRVMRQTLDEYGMSPEQFVAALAQQGLTLAEYRQTISKQLTKMKVVQVRVKNRVRIDDSQVKAAYARQKAIDAADYRVRVRHVLVPLADGARAGDVDEAYAKAQEIKARMETGGDVKVHAVDVGVFSRGEMLPSLERVAFSTAPGVVAGPVRSPLGWHVLAVTERLPLVREPRDEQAALDAVRDQLFRDELDTQFRAYVDELKRDAHIEKRGS
jgi:peptidyl-prolyl cis-trans isomerase SurA